MLKQAANATGRQDRIIRNNGAEITACIMTYDTAAHVAIAYQIYHGVVFDQGNIRSGTGRFQQMRGDLLTCLVLMEKDAGFGMGTLPGVVERLSVFFKIDTVGYQIPNHILRGTDHDLYGLGIILIVSGLHGIFVEGLEVIFIPKNTDAALGQERVTFRRFILCDDGDLLVFRQIQCAI